MTSLVSKVKVKKVTADESSAEDDLLAIEEPLEIRIGHGPEDSRKSKSLAVTMRTPGNDFELAAGFLFSESIITSYNQIRTIRYCADPEKPDESGNVLRVELEPDLKVDLSSADRNFYANSSCGVCGKATIDSIKVREVQRDQLPEIRVSEKFLQDLPATMKKEQSVYKHTGGLHAAGLFDLSGELVLLREDIGRHNALDKLIGAALAKDLVPLGEHVVLLSGRAGFELVQKSVVSGIQVLAAVGAPSSLAKEVAAEFDMTLVGFLRNESFNIYHGEWRIESK